MQNMHKMTRICKICAPSWPYEHPPFPYEHTLYGMHNMAEYGKKYAESEHTPKKYAKKLKNSKISKICHLKTKDDKICHLKICNICRICKICFLQYVKYVKYVEYTKYVIPIDNLKQWQVDNLGCGGMRVPAVGQ